MTLTLTPEQTAAVVADWQPGFVLLAKIAREGFTGQNAETAGGIYLEFGHVPAGALPGIKEAVAKARKDARIL